MTLEMIFEFLTAVKWPLTILVIILILRRSFKKFKEDITRATVERIMNDKNKEHKNES